MWKLSKKGKKEERKVKEKDREFVKIRKGRKCRSRGIKDTVLFEQTACFKERDKISAIEKFVLSKWDWTVRMKGSFIKYWCSKEWKLRRRLNSKTRLPEPSVCGAFSVSSLRRFPAFSAVFFKVILVKEDLSYRECQFCSLLKVCQRFRRPYCLQLQCRWRKL
jgi:hypothetical protein